MSGTFMGRLLFEDGTRGGSSGAGMTSTDGDRPGAGRSSWVFNPYLILAMRVLLAAVFIYAALQKIGRPLLFADEIRMYRILDLGPLLYTIAIVLPWLEILCGISLLTGIFMRGSALILTVFNLLFIAVISWRTAGVMKASGTRFMEVYFDCGCGFGATYAWKKLIEDTVFMICSLLVFLPPCYRFTLNVFWRRKI